MFVPEACSAIAAVSYSRARRNLGPLLRGGTEQESPCDDYPGRYVDFI